MSKKRNWTVFGFLDIVASIYQMLVTLSSALLSIHFYLKTKIRDGESITDDIVATLNLVFAVFVLYANAGQILAAQKLATAGNQNTTADNWDRFQIRWAKWNGLTCIGTLIWCPLFGATISHDYTFPAGDVGLCLVMVIGTRTILLSGFYNFLVEEEVNVKATPIPSVDMELSIETRR